MKRYGLALWLVLVAGVAWGQISVPAEIKAEPGAFVKVPATTTGKEVRWYSPDKGLQVFPVELLKDSKTAVVIATAPGKYRLICWTAVEGVPSDPAICTVIIGSVPPGPDPPPPPDPTPATGKRCLIIYETAELSKMPEKQQQILFGKTVRDYLREKTELSPDGKSHECGAFDKDVDLGAYSKELQGMFKRPRTQVPWVVIGNSKSSYEGPLPATVEEFMTLAKKYLEN